MASQSPPAPLYCITLLRHGESLGNYEGRHQGQADFPLTDRGRIQTQALLKRWKSERISFDLIISSPLKRARETAEMISAELKILLEFDPLWMGQCEADGRVKPRGVLETLPPTWVYLSILLLSVRQVKASGNCSYELEQLCKVYLIIHQATT
jgi:hypothetical protein